MMSTIDRATTSQVYELISNVAQIAGLMVQETHAWLSGEGNGIRYHPFPCGRQKWTRRRECPNGSMTESVLARPVSLIVGDRVPTPTGQLSEGGFRSP